MYHWTGINKYGIIVSGIENTRQECRIAAMNNLVVLGKLSIGYKGYWERLNTLIIK